MTGANLNVVLTEYFGIGDLCPAQSSLTEVRLKLSPKFFAKVFHSFMDKLLPYLPEERDLYGMAFLGTVPKQIDHSTDRIACSVYWCLVL